MHENTCWGHSTGKQVQCFQLQVAGDRGSLDMLSWSETHGLSTQPCEKLGHFVQTAVVIQVVYFSSFSGCSSCGNMEDKCLCSYLGPLPSELHQSTC